MEFWTAEPRAEFTIEDLPEGVRFQVRPERVLVSMIWTYVYLSLLAYLLTGFAGGGLSWARAGMVLSLSVGLGTWMNRPLLITTMFSREGVRVTGALGSGAQSPRWTPLETIAELAWRPYESGDGDSPGRPAGLYARSGMRVVCVVPFLDAEQARRAIAAVEQKFHWADRVPGSCDSLLFTDDLVRLHLGE